MMKKYILLIAILFASCAEQNQEPKTAGYFIQDEEETYMIGSDDTTDFIKKWADAHNERDMESILSMEKTDIHIELPDGTVIDGQDEHSKVLETFLILIMINLETILEFQLYLIKAQKTF